MEMVPRPGKVRIMRRLLNEAIRGSLCDAGKGGLVGVGVANHR